MLKQLLITGANGGLGPVCRQCLGHPAETVRLGALEGLGEAGPNEEIVYCDLSDKAAVEAIRAKIDAGMEPPPADDAAAVFQGGAFCSEPIHESRE